MDAEFRNGIPEIRILPTTVPVQTIGSEYMFTSLILLYLAGAQVNAY